MRALTICQPYAELIMRGQKRVENRRWPTGYRGALLIHAGKSRQWLEPIDCEHIPLAEMVFGAVVGLVQLRGCIRWHGGIRCDPLIVEAWPWLPTHEHAEGPYCWILEDIFRFSEPIPFRGQQGLFDVPAALVAIGLREAMKARCANHA
ncbi:MAG: ASCH domain-containing protein [Thermoguttaceae bacterium]|jgi:hypothetical protein